MAPSSAPKKFFGSKPRSSRTAQQKLVSAYFTKKPDAPKAASSEPALKRTLSSTPDPEDPESSNKKQKTQDSAEDAAKEPIKNVPHPPKTLSKPDPKTLQLLSSQRQKKFSYSRLANDEISLTQEQIEQKQTRHQEFYDKLHKPGSIEQIIRRSKPANMADPEANDEDPDETGDGADSQDAEDCEAVLTKRGGKKAAPKKKAPVKKPKLTPMNQQYVDLKKQHPDIILLVETGYKHKVFGMDAKIVSQELGIFLKAGKLTLDENDPQDAKYLDYAYTTFLSTRLNINIERLVEKGHKVGVVEQMETAAIKAHGKNKSAPFERKLTHVYTKGTMLDLFETRHQQGRFDNQKAGYLMAITQGTSSSSSAPTDNEHIGIVAVQASTGDIMYDDFVDSSVMHTELETRLLHIQPSEILIVGDINDTTKKLLKQLAVSKALSSEPRIEKVKKLAPDAATNFVASFYNKKAHEDAEKTNTIDNDMLGQKLDMIDTLSDNVRICLAALMTYLKEFGLDVVFDLTNNFSAFSSQTHMHLNGNTIMSLELFQNLTNFKAEGSLFHVLDYTRTPFGQRQLRKWIARPLIDRTAIEARIEAVRELKAGFTNQLGNLIKMMTSISDLEKALISVYYHRTTRKQLYYFLTHMQCISKVIYEDETAFQFESKSLNTIFSVIPRVYERTVEFLAEISEKHAKENDKMEFFLDSDDGDYEEISEKREEAAQTEDRIQEYLLAQKRELKMTTLKYETVSGTPYYLSVGHREASKIPESWLKHSKTVKEGRYRSTELNELVKNLNYLHDTIAALSEELFHKFLDRINVHYDLFRSVIHALADLDCYLSLAAIAAQKNYVCPEFVDYSCCNIKQGRHPVVEQGMLSRGGYSYVPNDTDMAYDHNRALIVTGPNMGGKSSYVRQIALTCIMAQIGSHVPAESATLSIVDAVYTRMGANDNIMAGESTFQVELKECSDILRSATSRSLVLLDEIGRGTGTMDGVAIAHAVLETFIRDICALTLFVTHYPLLARLADKYGGGIVGNYHMGFLEEPNDKVPGESKVVFLYNLVKGVAHNSYGYVLSFDNSFFSDLFLA